MKTNIGQAAPVPPMSSEDMTGASEVAVTFGRRWVDLSGLPMARTEEVGDPKRSLKVMEFAASNGDTVALTRSALEAMTGVGPNGIPDWPEDGEVTLSDETRRELEERFTNREPRPEGVPAVSILITGPGDLPKTMQSLGSERDDGYSQVAAYVTTPTEAGDPERLVTIVEVRSGQSVRGSEGAAGSVPRGNVAEDLLAGVPGHPSRTMMEITGRAVELDQSRIGPRLLRAGARLAAAALDAALPGSGAAHREARLQAADAQRRAGQVERRARTPAETYLGDFAGMVVAVQEALRR